MNATKWPSLTEFAKHLGRESICRVEETEKGLHISWIDNSPEALRRQEALRKRDAQAQGDEELEQRIIREQIKRAQAQVGEVGEEEKRRDEVDVKDGEGVTLSFGKKTDTIPTDPKTEEAEEKKNGDEAPKAAFSFKPAGKPQVKNVFAKPKKNALASGAKKPSLIQQPQKISEAERIMKQEMDRKRSRDTAGFSMPFGKKPRKD